MTRGGRRSTATGLVALAAASLAGAGRARAEIFVELGPAISVGWTDAAAPARMNLAPQADEFGTVTGMARGRYVGKKTEQGLGYRLSLTKYLHQRAADSASQEVAYLSTYNLTPRLDLTVGAVGAYSKTSAFVLQDQSATTQLAVAGAFLTYVTGTINQSLTYRPTARRRYIESMSFARMHYLSRQDPSAAVPIMPMVPVEPRPLPPDTMYINGHLRAEWERARDTFSLDGALTDSYSDNPRTRNTIGPHRILATGLAGYHRDFSMAWSADIALGGTMILTTYLAGIAAPAGIASVSWRRLYWFATATVSQTAAPNIFLGNATLNDSATVHVAVPLTRSELLVLSGNGGYTYARFADQNRQEKAYSLWAAGASLTWRPQRLPIWTSLDYTFTDQTGSDTTVYGQIPSRTRNAIMLTVGGSFVFGKGTPPIIQGAL